MGIVRYLRCQMYWEESSNYFQRFVKRLFCHDDFNLITANLCYVNTSELYVKNVIIMQIIRKQYSELFRKYIYYVDYITNIKIRR